MLEEQFTNLYPYATFPSADEISAMPAAIADATPENTPGNP